MNDTQILNWIEENVFEIYESMNDTLIIRYYDLEGVPQKVEGENLHDCVEKVNKKQVMNKLNEKTILVNWENLPDWANYVAMDNDGTVWVFNKKPIIDLYGRQWINDQEDNLYQTMLFLCDWRNTLLEK